MTNTHEHKAAKKSHQQQNEVWYRSTIGIIFSENSSYGRTNAGRRLTAAALLCIVPSRANYAIITWPPPTMREFRLAAAFMLFCRTDVFHAARYYPNQDSISGLQSTVD